MPRRAVEEVLKKSRREFGMGGDGRSWGDLSDSSAIGSVDELLPL
ncbi:MAG: hypothetical protein ACJA16_001838 [Akkermansiaceae bacterium]